MHPAFRSAFLGAVTCALLTGAQPDPDRLIARANQLSADGKVADAEQAYKTAISEAETAGRVEETAKGLNNLGALLYRSGRYAEAQPVYERALAAYRSTYGMENNNAAICLSN